MSNTSENQRGRERATPIERALLSHYDAVAGAALDNLAPRLSALEQAAAVASGQLVPYLGAQSIAEYTDPATATNVVAIGGAVLNRQNEPEVYSDAA